MNNLFFYLKIIIIICAFICSNVARSDVLRDEMNGIPLSCNVYNNLTDDKIDASSQLFYNNVLKDKFKIPCAQPTTSAISFIYDSSKGAVTVPALKVNDPYVVIDGIVMFRAVPFDTHICVQTRLYKGWQTLGCIVDPALASKAAAFQEVVKKPKDCSIGASCANQSNFGSRSLVPFTSILVDCISSSMAGFFNGVGCKEGEVTFFKRFQDSMRLTVKATLTLYVIFFGIKTMLAGDMPKKSEIIMALIKFVLVLYFSVGIPVNNDDGMATQYEDGISSFVMPAFYGAASSLANIVFQGAQGNGLCRFDPADYKDDANLYTKFAMWDSIDCRISYYLGITNPMVMEMIFAPLIMAAEAGSTIGGTDGAVVGGVIAAVGVPIYALIFPLLMGLQIILVIFSIVFCICVISIAVYFINIFILSLIALTLVGYFAPIFVPCALFQVTKNYYDAWLKLMISYALQPAVIAAFIALMFTTFDQAMYGECKFKKQYLPSNVITRILNLDAPIFLYQNSTDPKCTDSAGYMLNKISSAPLDGFSMMFFKVQFINNWTAWQIFPAMFKMSVLGFLFWHFSSLLGDFAADLTGGSRLGRLAISPTAFAELAYKMGKAAMNPAEGAKDAAKDMPGGGEASAVTQRAGGGGGDAPAPGGKT